VQRRLVPADSPYAPSVGYSRAVRVGNHVYVSGTAPVMPDGGDPPADAYGQARRCLEIISEALLEAGASLEDVVRTRIFLVNEDDWEGVGRAHHEFLGDVMPASTMVLIQGILDPRWVVEIEADAVVAEGK
jgi:enamine deaminase RidA (YjgF/YER057c/UK114 family)